MSKNNLSNKRKIIIGSITLFLALFSVILSACSLPFGSNKVNIYQVNYGQNSTVNQTDITAVVEKIDESVVEIQTTLSGAISRGSGVIINTFGMDNLQDENLANSDSSVKRYFIITNHHVIEDGYKFTVTITDRKLSYNATLVGSDKASDIAVLMIQTSENFKTATFANSDQIKKGQNCIVIGNPLGLLGGSVSAGIVSYVNRKILFESTVMDLIQTTATINSGNSGGGMFDYSGNLIGIVNSKANGSNGTNVEGIGFAIPSNIALNVFANLINTSTILPSGTVTSYGYVPGRINLGVALSESNGSVSITGLTSNSPLLLATTSIGSAPNLSDQGTTIGVKVGDKLKSINSYPVSKVDDYINFINNANIGDTAKLVFVRQPSYFSTQYLTQTITITQYVYTPPTI